MSELQTIHYALGKAAQRRRWERAWRGLWNGLFIAALLWLLTLICYKLLPMPLWFLALGGLAGLVVTLAGFVAGICSKNSLTETARWIDRQEHLQERLSTAVELAAAPGAGSWKDLLLKDAAVHARALDPRRLLPLRVPRVSRWALLILALGAGLGFVPEYRSKSFLQKQNEAANIRDTGKHLADLTRRSLEQKPPFLEPTEKAMETIAELGQQLASLNRGEALRELANAAEKLKQEEKELGRNPALKTLERAAREAGGSGAQTPQSLQKQTEALQQALGNQKATPQALDKFQESLQKAQQAAANLPARDSAGSDAARQQLAQSLAALAQQARDIGQSASSLEEAIKALENNQTDALVQNMDAAMNELEKSLGMARALEQLQQQASKLGKDLAEQLKQGQAEAAQETLKKMIAQLQTPDLASEQLQTILQEVSQAAEPGSKYGKVGQHLKDAAQKMEGSNKPGAAQSLAAAARELESLLQQMSDAEALAATLEALERAQLAIATGKGWGQCLKPGICQSCNGQGCSQCGWGNGARGGPGVGTWADETGWIYTPPSQAGVDNSGVARPDMEGKDASDRGPGQLSEDLKPTKVKGQLTPAGPMPSITLKGVSIKGQSTVGYQEAATAAQNEAQSALNQDQVPRAYRGAVRDYFDDLKK